MKQISNEALMALLVISIVVSILGTITSINKVSNLLPLGSGITGFASTGTGAVNVSISELSSIAILDNKIDFGSCAPNSSIGSNLSSNDSNGWGSPGTCTLAGVSPTASTDSINITNDGNNDVNISISINNTAANIIGGTSPQVYFIARNHTTRPGCFNGTKVYVTSDLFSDATNASRLHAMQWGWEELITANKPYPACLNLTYPDATDTISIYIRLSIPPDAPAKDTAAGLTFTATNV